MLFVCFKFIKTKSNISGNGAGRVSNRDGNGEGGWEKRTDVLKSSSDGRKVLVKVMRMFLAIYTSLKVSSKT